MIDQVRTFFAARLSQMKEKGASAVEYGLLVAGIAAVIVVAIFALSPMIREAFEGTCADIASGSTLDTESGTTVDCDGS